MSPARKASAYLHLPTYTAGLIYHSGTFLSFFLFFFILTGNFPGGWLALLIVSFLTISALGGIGIFIKRIVKQELKSLSNPDDFISNLLVTLFQVFTVIILLCNANFISEGTTAQLANRPTVQLPNRPTVQLPNSPTVQLSNCPTAQLIYFLHFTLLMLYVPVGKLRHLLYFFAARYHLGFFYGRRGVWPSGNINSKAG
jgi:nitrate reductase gamma subunit